jgi:protein TonB
LKRENIAAIDCGIAFSRRLSPETGSMMFSAAHGTGRPEIRQRLIAIAITLVIEALFVLALLTLGWQETDPKVKRPGLTTFNVQQEAAPKSAADSMDNKATSKNTVTQQNKPRAVQEIPPPILPSANPVRLPPASKDYIKVTKQEYDAMDISKFPVGGGSASKSDGKGDGRGTGGLAIGPGEGPGGAPLYNAEWVREPVDAELAPYFSSAKARPAGAWAMIACKTLEHNRVENCQQMGESPAGTGLAKALRLAAWQFQVRAPRVGNKPQIGVWVRIRFDFTKPASDGDPGGG